MKNKINLEKMEVKSFTTIIEKSELHTLGGGSVFSLACQYLNPENMKYEIHMIAEVVYQPIEW